jgi:hypothetical protein
VDIAQLEKESAELLPDRQALCCWNYSWHSCNSWHGWQGWNDCHNWQSSWSSWSGCGH